jgi:hypothetical protein
MFIFFSPPQFLLERLVRLFGELRSLVDAGTLQHPYSLRELVQIVKHLDRFPDNLASVLHNVFSLDLSNAAVAPLLKEVLRRHGIPVEVVGAAHVVRAAWKSFADRAFHEWAWTEQPEVRLSGSDSAALLRHRPWKWRPEQSARVRGRLQSRIECFSELVFSLNLPPRSTVADCVCSRSGTVHVLLSSPVHVLSYSPDFSECGTVDLSAHLPYHRSSLPARPRIFALEDTDLLIVFLPVYRVLIVVDEPGCFATPVQIPTLDVTNEGGTTSFFNEQMFPDPATLRGGAKPTQVLMIVSSFFLFFCFFKVAVGEFYVAAWSVGGRLLCFMDVVSLEWSHSRVVLPFDLDSVVFSGRAWLLQPEKSTDVFALDSSDMSLLRRFSTSNMVPLLAGHGLSLSSTCDLVLLAAERGYNRFPLSENEGGKVVQARKLQGAPLLVVQTNASLLVVDAERKMMRPICGDRPEEEKDDPVVSFCELEQGQLLVAKNSGIVQVYDCNSERLAEEEKIWRVIVGLKAEDDVNEDADAVSDEEELRLKIGGVAVDLSKPGEGQGEGQGSGGGVGGGRGPGSGGEGEGSGGTSGIRRQVKKKIFQTQKCVYYRFFRATEVLAMLEGWNSARWTSCSAPWLEKVWKKS